MRRSPGLEAKKMTTSRRTTEEDAFNLSIGLGAHELSDEEKHFFDIAGYLVLKDVLSPEQLAEARGLVAHWSAEPPEGVVDRPDGDRGRELLNLVEAGGVFADAMALSAVLPYLESLIWGRQIRLVGSCAVLRRPGETACLTQGGAGDARRYAAYRCFGNGQFRCLLLTCYIPLSDTDANNGAFCAIPASHKSNLPHPFGEIGLNEVPPLKVIELSAGSAVLLTESLSHAFKAPEGESQTWLAYHYGPSFMMNFPDCNPSPDLVRRVQGDAAKAHLLLEPYYHPDGSQKYKKD